MPSRTAHKIAVPTLMTPLAPAPLPFASLLPLLPLLLLLLLLLLSGMGMRS